MRHGGFDSVRIGIPWNGIEPSPGDYDFSSVDANVARAARHQIEVFPFVGATPTWAGVNCTTQTCFTSLPSQTETQKQAWANILRRLVERYGPGGVFWSQHGPGTVDPLPYRPIRIWQMWNEANFFFFTDPRSPTLYAELVKVSKQAISAVDPGAQIILAGLFAKPRQQPPLAYQATDFLDQVYDVPGIKDSFDGVALHPYAADASHMAPTIEAMRDVMERHDDAGTDLYITEMGWGSGTDTAFERGLQGQVAELAEAYQSLRDLQRTARISRAYWFSWDDLSGSCNFCESIGLFTEVGQPKPAWFRFVQIAGCFGRNATILGTDGPESLTGTPGNDVIEALGGDDVINGGGGNDFICGGDGADRLSGNAGRDRLLGQLGNDRLSLHSGADWAWGGGGHDLLIGLAGPDTLIGDEGSDRLRGGNGNDKLFGGLGRDVLLGAAGNDRLRGGNGRDRLFGGSGRDDERQ
jgi:Ca2+-binding RTX toxin-like protein